MILIKFAIKRLREGKKTKLRKKEPKSQKKQQQKQSKEISSGMRFPTI